MLGLILRSCWNFRQELTVCDAGSVFKLMWNLKKLKEFVGAVFACIPLFFKRGNRDELGGSNALNRGYKPLPPTINFNINNDPELNEVS